jgi:UDP-3-O-[3-hydroxymyristoyl] N-acetylglucosamine deacetylase
MIGKYQGTIKSKVKFAGVGLHSGRLVNLEVLPAAANTGIMFQRTDSSNARVILAHPFNVSSTALCTSIGQGEDEISTIEHLMASFFGLGIDNALVRVDSSEIPILDGSAAPFVDKLKVVGIDIQKPFARKLFVVKKAFEIRQGDQFIRVDPADSLSFDCSIDFDCSTAIGKQNHQIDFNQDSFLKLCEARTFCHVNDVNAMREAGLAQGGSLDNAIVVDDSKVINADGLRYNDEFVRHKLLDCLGDLGLLGGYIVGKITTNKSGHAMHAQFTSEFLRQGTKVFETVIPGINDVSQQNYRQNGAEGLGLVASQILTN